MSYFYGALAYIVNNIIIYLAVLGVVSIAFFFVYRKQINDIFDPMLFMVVGQVFAATMIIIMAIGGLARNYLDMSVALLCLLSLNMGITNLFSARVDTYEIKANNTQKDILDNSIIYYLLFIIYLIIKIIILIMFGEASSYDNHVLYTDTTKKITIIYGFLSFVILFLSFKRYCENKRKVATVFFVLYVFECLVSGSKSSLLSFGACLFFYKLYYGDGAVIKKMYKLSIFLAVLGLIFTVAKAAVTGGVYSILSSIMVRFAGFGDTYAYAFYDNSDVLNTIMLNNDAYTLLLNPILSMLRLVTRVENSAALGNQLVNIAYSGFGTSNGPNARYVIFFMVAFGKLLSIPFSFILGKIIYCVRKKLYRPKGTLISYLILANLYKLAIKAVTDPGLAYYELCFLLIFTFIFGVLIGTLQKRHFSIILPKI